MGRSCLKKTLGHGVALAVLWCAGAVRAADAPLVLLIQPLPSEERGAQDYRALAAYIETHTGRACTIEMPPSFPAYWEAVRRHRYDLALDAPHFTDYRLQKFGFTALVKTPDAVSYSLVMRRAERAYDPAQLVGKRIASLGLLSVGTLRLNAIFPNAMRQPVLVETRSAEESVRLLLRKNVDAAFLPTAIVSTRIARGELAVVLTTEPIPRFGLSAAPRVPPELREKIRLALLQAHETDTGRAMLRALGLERFAPAGPEDFANQSYVLRGYWGY